MSDVKTIDSLMRYLRDNHNIQIHGSTQKKKLKNIKIQKIQDSVKFRMKK